MQYLGLAKDRETGLPVLLMELMDDSLTHFLEKSEKPLAYHVQVNISHDIALAVAFLHLNRIVHRDLSSNNVLVIGAGCRAKVTDFGMSKLTLHTKGLTKCPGTPAYMAPEALLDPPVYTEKLDCFQEGVLMIQTITRKFPDPGPAMNRVKDAKYPTGWANAPVPEVERRENHLSLIPQTHPMLRIALDCLKDMDSERPLAQQICQYLSALKEAPQYKESLAERRTQSDEEIQGREQLIHQLKQENQEREREVGEKERAIRERDEMIESLQKQKGREGIEMTKEKEGDVESLLNQLQQKEEEAREQEKVVRELRKENENLQNEVQEREKVVMVKNEEIQNLQGAIEIKTQLLREKDQLLQERDQTIHQLQQIRQSASSNTCLVSGPGLLSATANHPTHVIVELGDSSGRPYSQQQTVTAELVPQFTSQGTPTSGGRWPWSKKTQSRSELFQPLDVAVAMISSSQYEVSYTAIKRGQHKLHVRVDGNEIHDSPFTITTYPDPTQLGSPVRVMTDLKEPYGITFNSRGELMITEHGGHRVSVFDTKGQRIQKLGSHGDRPEQMKYPAGIAVDDTDNIYVSSQHKLQKFTSSGELIKSVGRRGTKTGEFDDPCGVTTHNSQVYVCDPGNHRIQVFSLDLNFIQCIGSRGNKIGELSWPHDVAFDATGNMYVADHGNSRVQVMDTSRHFIRAIGHKGEAKLRGPVALHVADKYVYVSDRSQHCIVVYQTSGHFVTSLGTSGQEEGKFSSPWCITSCANGFIHVCDTHNNRVQTF